MSIFDVIEAEKAVQRQSDLVAYYRLLPKVQGNADPAHYERFIQLLDHLDISPDQAREDLLAVEKVAATVGAVIETLNCEDHRTDANLAHEKAAADRQRVHLESNQKLTAATVQRDAALAECSRHTKSQQDLRDLRSTNPSLYLAIVKPNERNLNL